MKIAIDARAMSAGVGRYTRQLLEHLQEVDKDNQYIVLLQQDGFDKWRPKSANFTKQVADSPRYGLSEQWRFTKSLKKLDVDLVHFTEVNQPIFYRGAKVTTIHDLTMVDYKNIQGNPLKYLAKYWGFRFVVWWVVKNSNHIITPSRYVKDQLVSRYRRDAQDITVIYDAATKLAAEPQPVSELADKTFLLYVGNAYPHKNLQHLVDAFAVLREHHPHLILVLAGKTDFFYNRLQRYVKEREISGIVFTGFLPDEQLAWLYQQAVAYVFPSLSEGFGLPGLEAMAHNLPVAAARATCLPEVYGDAAVYFDPCSIQDMAHKVSRLIDDQQLRKSLTDKGGERVERFSWQKTAEQTTAIYQWFDTKD